MQKIIQSFLMTILFFMFSSCSEERLINEPGNLVPKTVLEDSSLSQITVNGVKLHSEAFGNPSHTMVVVVHGGPGGDYRYLLNCKELADQGYYVVFYDQRGSGLSQRLADHVYLDRGIEAISDLYIELRGVIEHYKTSPTQKVVLLGHSWGGILASGFAGSYPNLINGLVVCEPGGLKWNDIKYYVEKSRSFKLWSELSNDAAYMDQFLTGNKNDHEILDYKLNLLASKNDITDEDNTKPSSFWRSGGVIITTLFEIAENYNPDFSENLQNFTPNTLFFYSDKNRAYPTSWANKIGTSFSSVTINRINGVGHDGIISNQQVWQQQTMPRIIQYIQSL
ncbi:alpha/beta hydrolase [Flavobacterium sp. UMI-01]|uniref:alpha/beta hydrolase n=1 Tax=Flavobacterium sp. UMI-01 TaxID=1441053 RepID=UPI001C7DE6D4|nr:alpha/beta hydrolase [Flavobacterium sp. UMI-01]